MFAPAALAERRRRAIAVGVVALIAVGGALTVFRADALPPIIDLNTTSADLTVFGDDATDTFNSISVATGDVNGDTTDDLIVGAYQADPPGGNSAGETYVIYGGPSLPAIIDLNATGADLTVFGDDAGDLFGVSVASGDINGDTMDDLIVGAHGGDPPGGSGAGKTYVIYGGPSLPTTIDLNSTTADLTVFGDDAGDTSGRVVATGDINGDGTEDLIIGAHQADPLGGTSAGETYVIFGGASLPTTIDLNSVSADLTVFGSDALDESGSALAAGDIDGDTTEDLIIGARGADPAGNNSGETYVVYGGVGLPATIDLNTESADLTVFGDDANDQSGQAVAAADINGDTTSDLIIGAPLADPPGGAIAGETYVIYGDVALPATFDLNSTSASLTVFGDDAFDASATAVAGGDIDGDTIDDLIIGAFRADPNGGDRAGETYVIYGGASLPVTFDLNNTDADLTVFGDDPLDESGSAVTAGDINGDTAHDLIIGAAFGDGAGTGTSCGPGQVGDQCNAGETYVLFGEPPPPGVGGIAELPDVAGTPLEAEGSSGVNAGVLARVVAAVTAGAIALGGAAWYARRRRR